MKLDEIFNQQDFNEWTELFLPEFTKDVRKVDIPISFSGVKSITTLGESSFGVRVYTIETDTDPAKRRISLAKDSFNLLKNYGTPNALIAYYCNESPLWRLSLLTSTPSWSDGKIITKLSNPKRQSYVLGQKAKVNTPHRFLVTKGKIADFADLKSRFSIEVVNKEFYKEISQAFTKLVGGMLKLPSLESKNQAHLEFAVRLIGRTIFCWFLREKKSQAGLALMPKDLLSINAVNDNSDYYHKVLEPIFFEILNKPARLRVDDFVKEPFSSVPYLNGGLFSPQYDDYYKRTNDDFQSQYHNTLVIPDSWFKDFFEILETYNFTIDENTSYDEELSIDPEMLGRIFENLLAEINPQTGESARKSTGSYYTPRIIVNYMVDESLLLYLKEQTQISEEKLRAIISYDLNDDIENPLNVEEKEKIIDALEKVKILDPACGSGAFPVGALQKIVFILQQIDTDGKLWFKKQITTSNPELRRDLEKKFSNNELDFIRKLGVIRNSIYGIDIQPVATEISRLRCFLTLIVDEAIKDSDENRGIKPLPNLEFKFVTANSLIGLPEIPLDRQSKQPNMLDDFEKIGALKSVRNEYFTASGIEREQLKTEFNKIQKELIYELVQEHGAVSLFKTELTNKLTSWDPFGRKPSSWFNSEWMFGVKDGFDIVIGNPPYIDSEGMVNNKLEYLREYIVKNYNYTRGNWDIYIAFFEKGFSNLNSGGLLTFISPDKWISKPFGSELRKNKYNSLYSILNAGREVFENATVDSIVSIFYNKKLVNNLKVYKLINGLVSFIRNYDKSGLNPPFALDCVFSYHIDLTNKLDKFLSNNSSLNCENACATSDAYKLSPLIKDLVSDYDSNTVLKVINTGTIGKWSSKWGLKDMTYLGKKYSRPIVSKKHFFDEFQNSYSVKSIRAKLILKGLNLLDVCLDSRGEFVPGKSTLIISGFNEKHLKYLMGYLNTPLPLFYLKEKYPAYSYNQGITFTKDMINNLPVPPISSAAEGRIVHLVEKIIQFTASENYHQNSGKQTRVEEYKKQIDRMVYKLYSLTAEEIRIIENSVK